MERIRIGMIGAGTIAQVEHVPNLLRLHDRFALAGVFDPSAMARSIMQQRHGLPTFANLGDLLSQPLDAVVIATPDALHPEHVLAALARGLHVFCEKPLCYSPDDVNRLIAARDKAGKVLQVGYMKRFDPSFEAALDLLPGSGETLRQVAVEVHDPDAWPFVRHHGFQGVTDIPSELIADAAAKQREQAERAVGLPLDPLALRGFCGAYSSSLVHDVNAVHGLLDRLDIADGEIAGAQFFADGTGGHGAVRLRGGQALWTMTHLAVPGLADYRERITLYFDDALLELEFPSPYLNHQPTRLVLKRSDGHRLRAEEIRTGYEEAFVEELKSFWSAIAEGSPSRNTAEQARRDMRLLCALTRWHRTHQPQPIL